MRKVNLNLSNVAASSRYQKAGVQYILSSVIKELQKDTTRRLLSNYIHAMKWLVISLFPLYCIHLFFFHQIHLRGNGFLLAVVARTERHNSRDGSSTGGRRKTGICKRWMVHERWSHYPLRWYHWSNDSRPAVSIFFFFFFYILPATRKRIVRTIIPREISGQIDTVINPTRGFRLNSRLMFIY